MSNPLKKKVGIVAAQLQRLMGMTLFADLRQAVRSLRKSRGYTAACIAILALGIGANTTIFALLHSIILNPLPYPDSERLVFVWNTFRSLPEPLASRTPVTREMYDAWGRAKSFSDIGGFIRADAWESGVERPTRIRAAFVTQSLLSMLGAQPVKGRLFGTEDLKPGQDRVVLLSENYFAKRFNRDPNILGRTLALENVTYTVAGVLPAGFSLPATFGGANREQPDVFLPASLYWTRAEKEGWGNQTAQFVPARLKPGVSIDQARAEIDGLSKQVQKANPDGYPPGGFGVNVFSILEEDRTPGVERQLLFLLGAVGFFLLIACANLANLTLTRMENRSREMAIRLAIGATRGRLVRHLVLESLLLSAAGAALGVALAIGLSPALLAWIPDSLDRPDVFAFRWPVFAFATVAAALTTLLFGVLPALATRKTDPHTWIKSAGTAATASASRSRRLLMTAEVAFTVVLLVGAGLMVRTLINYFQTPLGVDMDPIGVVQLALPEPTYTDEASREKFLLALADRVRKIPGVQSAAVTTNLPMVGWTTRGLTVEGRPLPPGQEFITANDASITPDYLRTLGIPLIAGRDFTTRDLDRNAGKGDGVALVTQTFAQRLMTGENPIGRHLRIDGRRYEVVGITGDFRVFGPAKPIEPQFFLAGVRTPASFLVFRTSVPLQSLAEPLRQAFRALDKGFVEVELISYRDAFYEIVIPDPLFATYLLGAFSLLGLLLAMTGVYSVLSYLVNRRRREIGIRMAIGASTSAISRMVAAQTMSPVITGIVAGVLGSLALTRFLEATLFQVSPRDPVTIAFAVLAVVLVVPLAIWLPMRRATRVECAAVLRED
jgi:putative ABC transport system permease protein